MITATGEKAGSSSTIAQGADPAQDSASGLALPRLFRASFSGETGVALKERLASVPPLAWLLLLTLALLAPFAGKAFFVDDTLFLRAAAQIQQHPLDFYGFNINWYGYTTPMTVAFDNPPLVSYYIAWVASLFGWSEWALHLAFLLPALAAVWGTFALAQHYCDRPFTAALIALLTPVFLISATTVMCDVTLLAFWIWTVVFFEKGLRTGSRTAWMISGALAGLAFLTKYLGLSLIPLLLAYGVCVKRKPGWWLIAPLIPLLFVAGYQWLTFKLYGHGLLLSAANEATKFRAHAYIAPWEKGIIGTSFIGACFMPVLFYTPWLWPRRMILSMLCLLAAGLLIIPFMAAYATVVWKSNGHLAWGMFFFISTLVVTGLAVFLLAVFDLWERRDAVSVLLFLWLSGVFVFTVALNWTINGRSLLPAIPAVGILAARRIGRKHPQPSLKQFMQFVPPAFAMGVISLLLMDADCRTANAQRVAATQIGEKYRAAGKTTWFNDHWGFQYYIEGFGARAVEQRDPQYSVGDLLVITSNTLDFDPKSFNPGHSEQLRLIGGGKVIGTTYLSTADPGAEAGFYGTCVGILPFAIGDIAPQYFEVFQVVKTPVKSAKGCPPGSST